MNESPRVKVWKCKNAFFLQNKRNLWMHNHGDKFEFQKFISIYNLFIHFTSESIYANSRADVHFYSQPFEYITFKKNFYVIHIDTQIHTHLHTD